MRIIGLLSIAFILGCETDKSITVQNPTPKASIVSHSDGDSVLEGFTTRFVGSVTDSNHTPDQLSTKWYLNGDVYCDDVLPNEFGETVCEFTLDAGEQEITLAVLDLENARGEASTLIDVTPTNPPVAEILSPVDDGFYYADQLLTFEGVVSDAEDSPDILSAYWESNLDGVLEVVDSTPSTSGQVLGYGNLSEGTHAIELHVADTTGKVHTDAVIVEVGAPNSDPTCGITEPISGAAGSSGELIVFEGFGDDVDISEDRLVASWSSDKDGSIGSSPVNSDGSIVFPFSDLSVNTHLISLTVEDEMGQSCTSSIVYTVGTPPTVVIDEPLDGMVVDEGTQISFAATVSDAQEQPNDIALDWELNGNAFATETATSTGQAMFVDSSLSFGTYNLVVTATDGDGLTDSDQITFTVNGVPTSPGVLIDPIAPVAADDLTVQIQTPSIDPDGSTISYGYVWKLGGVIQTAYTSSTLPSAATTKGDLWTVEVTPTDGTSFGAPGVETVTIQNTAPTVTSVSISNSASVYNDSQITCAATVSDPDESPTISYEWHRNGAVVGTGSALDVLPIGAMPTDVITCTATATDSDGATDTNSVSVTVQNRSPVVTASIVANGANNSGLLTCVEVASDPDGESPTATYEWFNATGSLGTGDSLQLDPSMGVFGDTIQCVVTVQDGFGGSATDTASHVIDNSPPSVDSLALSPNLVDAGTGAVSCTAMTSDADGDSVTVTYEWFIDGTLQNATGSTLLAAWEVATEVMCRATPSDGTDAGVSEEVSTTVQNTPPVASNVSLSPNQVYTNNILSASAVISDVDTVQTGALNLGYDWYVDNVLVQSGASSTLDGSVYFERDQSVYVSAIPNDGVEDGAAVSSPLIVVSNSEPVLSSLVITPASPIAGADDLYCDVIATDPDGDAVLYTYTWSDSTGVQQTTVEVSDTTDIYLSSGLTEDTWTCEVTPFDGTDYGALLTGTVLVESGCSSIELDGAQDGVLIGDAQDLLGVTGDFSISAWVWVHSPVASPSLPIFSAEQTNSSNVANNTGYSLRVINGSLAIFVGTGTTGTDNYPNPNWFATEAVPTEQWVHVAGTRQGSTIRLYMNGNLILEELNGPTNSLEYVAASYEHNLYYIGYSRPNGLSSSTEFSMDGKLSNIGVWNRGLSASEIQSLSQNAFDSTIADLVGFWPLDDGSGSVARDDSGIGNDGLLEGDALFGGSCPTEDVDGDGVLALEDCDDSDPAVSSGSFTSLNGPTLINNIVGWPNSGVKFTALTSTTLSSVTFNNQGGSDTVTLFDMTTNTPVQSLSVNPGSSAHVLTPNWSLIAGHTYSLKSADSANGRWAPYTTYPTQNAQVSVEGMLDEYDNLYTMSWHTFTNFVFDDCQ